MGVRIRFHGHACFSLEARAPAEPSGCRILLDPYEPGALGGAVVLPPLPDEFDFVACTHEHVDHNAVHTVPAATVTHGSATVGPFAIERRTAYHDEYGGRLRGGTTDILRIQIGGAVVMHLGDLGERPTGDLLAWLRSVPVDALFVPVGGYFTLSPLAAAEVVNLIDPVYAVPCHSADDGVTLPQLQPLSMFLDGQSWERRDTLDVWPDDRRHPAPQLVVLNRA